MTNPAVIIVLSSLWVVALLNDRASEMSPILLCPPDMALRISVALRTELTDEVLVIPITSIVQYAEIKHNGSPGVRSDDLGKVWSVQ